MSNLNGMSKRVDEMLVELKTRQAEAQVMHTVVVFYDPETGEPVGCTPEAFQQGRVRLPVKEYLFDPNDDGSEE